MYAKEMVEKLAEPFADLRKFYDHYQVRPADRDFQVGDTLILDEWDPARKTFTGHSCKAEIVHLTPPGKWGLPADVCAFGIRVKFFLGPLDPR